MQYFVRSGGLLGFPELVRQLGQNPSQLLRDVGLSVAVLHDRDTYIPYIKVAQLYERAAVACREPAFGLRLGQLQGLEVAGALGSCLALQNSVGDALAMLQKNSDFHARGARIEVEASGPEFGISFDVLFKDQTPCEQLIALSVALIVRGVSQLQQGNFPPTSVSFAFRGLGPQKLFERAFGCPVNLDAQRNQAWFPVGLLHEPIAIEPKTRQRLTAEWRGDIKNRQPLRLDQQLERAIDALLPTGECTLQVVARVLGVHERTLQQQLMDHGISYGAVLQRVRQRLACQHLSQSDTAVTTLALNLGYAEPAVFSRTFKKWTGMTPSAWRKHQHSDRR